MRPCDCEERHAYRRIVLTGGPGAGKTAVLEIIRHHFCPHVHILPESAGIVFGGGFPRNHDVEAAADFLTKARQVLDILREEVPECCRHHIKPVDDRTLAGV